MSDPQPTAFDPSADDGFEALLTQTIALVESGERIDVERLRAEHPRHADTLGAFFGFGNDLDAWLQSTPPRQSETDVPSFADQATIYDPDATAGLPDGPPSLVSASPTETPGAERSVPAGPDAIGAMPKRIAGYRVVRQLGHGTFGNVYEAYDERLDATVAIKQAKVEVLSEDTQRAAFLHEARTVAKLNHPSIVNLRHVIDTPGEPYGVVMEYLEGPTLKDVLDAGDRSQEDLARWVANIADALHYAHQRNIVHRDLKPANVIIAADHGAERPVVLDFGLALRDGQPFLRTGSFAGTAYYASPEQAANTPDWATPQSDVFALGAILYQALTGALPFQGESTDQVLERVRHYTPAAPSSLNDRVPPAFDAICRKALKKTPDDRYANAAEMARDIRAALAPPARQNKTMALAIAAAVLVSLGVGMFQRFADERQVVDGAGAGTHDAGSVILGETGTKPPEPPKPLRVEPSDPQKIALSVRIQTGGQPGEENVEAVKRGTTIAVGDGLHAIAETETSGPLAVFTISPSGTVEWLMTETLIDEYNPYDADTRWPLLNEVGTHRVVALSSRLPLTEDDKQVIERAAAALVGDESASGYDAPSYPAPLRRGTANRGGGDRKPEGTSKKPFRELHEVLKSLGYYNGRQFDVVAEP